MKMYLQDQNLIHQNEEFIVRKIILYLLLNKSNSFDWHVSLLFFVIDDNKLTQHMDQISEHINSSDPKIRFYE